MECTAILDSTILRQEIQASHARSKEYGVSRTTRKNQVKLTPLELSQRQAQNKIFLEAVIAQLSELFDLLSPDDFMVAVVDGEGYILHMFGSDNIKAKFAERNCAPGYRWTERDVGTTAISLCLERRIAVQLNDKDHYCQRAHGFTSSAAPVFGHAGNLQGILVVSGNSQLVHPHTLCMISSAARSVERQLRILRRNSELAMHIGLLDAVLESTTSGLMVIDSQGVIWRVNRKGGQILKKTDLAGQEVSVLQGLDLDIEDIRANPNAWVNRECTLKNGRQNIHILFSAQPVLAGDQSMLGVVLEFEPIDSVRKLANNIAGTKAFFTFESMIGSSESFRRAQEMAKRAAHSDSTVLLRGETGTGKELFAQAIHNASRRRSAPFVPINCGAIPGELLESELFGYVDGAFTGAQKGGRPGKFELAHRGTILLDEIGDMPHDMQVKLLRVLQTGEVYRIGARKPTLVDTRIIACTHVDLGKAVAAGRFREDLYYRLNVLPIVIPALRERGRDDILALTEFFLSRNRVTPPQLTVGAVKALENHPWPGNVRELENTIQRALHLCEENEIDAACLGVPETAAAASSSTPRGTLEEIERLAIEQTLEDTKGNMAETAKTLGISRATLYRKVKRYSLETG
ncbi:sigma-54-dependent Fis family transcriptional regulator [Desulfohalobium retbaense]|uniref:Sigma54 specific transcriptional regulator, Fis family n=1 Tax=Desulfohalobium retbaense (strain ATCC 49708 / DSM 5692 / JCM 16813 / HR100) TaxID=485915 RepID=C8WZA1_DESRD|nr:sigma-54-dependent Fis family transcriptional regulator [Desulfohalobium retbaense]ACV67376.1 sigma54 specific transcriptional regulator, Fis family [Desulfohalobium retbaense DSM 5692]